MIMKQKVLALSVAAALGGGILGTACASENVLETGVGHKMYIPYFTTQNGNATLINITNTDMVRGKAVKVRFRSAVDSDDIFDFQVFLSPGDVWTAAVTQNASGLSQLSTSDKSCTLPSNVSLPFVTARLQDYTDGNGTHGVNEQTREGYVEFFNMGDIPPFRPDGVGPGYVASTNANPLFTAIKHVAGVPPCTQATLLGIEAAAIAGGWPITAPALSNTQTSHTYGAASYAATQQIIAPTGTLMGDVVIINVPKTLTFGSALPAIIATTQTSVVYSGQSGTARTAHHYSASAGSVFPALGLTEDGVLLNGPVNGVRTADYDFPDMSTPYELGYYNLLTGGSGDIPSGEALNLSTAITHGGIYNEFMTDPAVNGGTDWVITLPTRRYHVAGRYKDYGTAGDAKGYPATVAIDAIAGGPTGLFGGAWTTYNANGRSSCVSTGTAPSYEDREEAASAGGGAVISPGVPFTYSLCGEVNVLSWNNTGTVSSTLGATLILVNSSSGSVVAGWATAPLATLPVVGDAYEKANNPNAAAGVSGNYGAQFKHRFY